MHYYIAVDAQQDDPNPHAWELDLAQFDTYADAEAAAIENDHEDGLRFGVPVLIVEAPPLLDARDVIQRIQNMRDEFNVPPADNEQTREDFVTQMDSEDYGRYQALGNVLDVLYLMAKGIEPAQGDPGGSVRVPEHCACGQELYADGHCPDGGSFCG